MHMWGCFETLPKSQPKARKKEVWEGLASWLGGSIAAITKM